MASWRTMLWIMQQVWRQALSLFILWIICFARHEREWSRPPQVDAGEQMGLQNLMGSSTYPVSSISRAEVVEYVYPGFALQVGAGELSAQPFGTKSWLCQAESVDSAPCCAATPISAHLTLCKVLCRTELQLCMLHWNESPLKKSVNHVTVVSYFTCYLAKSHVVKKKKRKNVLLSTAVVLDPKNMNYSVTAHFVEFNYLISFLRCVGIRKVSLLFPHESSGSHCRN